MFKERGKLRSIFERIFRESANEDMRAAAEILKETYEDFLKEAVNKGATGILGTAEIRTDETLRNGVVDKISVYVPAEGGGGNLVFHVLNGGRPALGHASNYTSRSGKPLKAWPLYLPRQEPNSPLTMAGSAQLNQVVSIEDVVFRPVIKNPTRPRYFVEEIEERAERRLRAEGFPDYITIKAVD